MKYLTHPLKSQNSGQVKPIKGSRLSAAILKNAQYMLSLDCDRLLSGIRQYAGLDTKGKMQYDGWEDSGRGIFYGHYLHACSLLYQTAKGFDEAIASEVKTRVDYIISSLKECSASIERLYPEQKGYLSASSVSELELAERLATVDGSHGAQFLPYYCHHKVMCGLAAVYRVFHNQDAFKLLTEMADYLGKRMESLSQDQRDIMLNTRRTEGFFMESGGMMEIYSQIYQFTKEEKYLTYARLFDRSWFSEMLQNNDDRLGLYMEHSNTEIPFALGMAEYYEATGDANYADMAQQFSSWIVKGHQQASGGISGRSAYPDYLTELFHYPNMTYANIMATPGHPNVSSGESCCAHNMNRLSEKLFSFTGDAAYLHQWERRFVNAVLSQQNPETGMFLYNLNLKQSARKQWGTPESSFWCCYGTGIEIFSSLTTGAYFTEQDRLWVGLYMACDYSWREKGVRIIQQTAYPDDGNIQFHFEMEQPQVFTLMLRLPPWLKRQAALQVNGSTQELPTVDGFFPIRRTWRSGDTVQLTFPFDLWEEPMPDAPEYRAVFYGPNLLVACTGSPSVFCGSAEGLLQSLKPNGSVCGFYTKLSSENNGIPVPEMTTYKPLRLIIDETYQGYTKVSVPPRLTVIDAIQFDNPSNLSLHSFTGDKLIFGDRFGIPYVETGVGGSFSFQMQVPHGNHPLLLRLTYHGDDRTMTEIHGGQPIVRLFDLQLQTSQGSWLTFCTQNLDGDYPGQYFDVRYPLPQEYLPQESLQFRISSKPFHEAQGIAGKIFGISLISYEQ